MLVFGSRVRDRVLWFGIVMNTMVGWLVGCDCLNFEIWESRDGSREQLNEDEFELKECGGVQFLSSISLTFFFFLILISIFKV